MVLHIGPGGEKAGIGRRNYLAAGRVQTKRSGWSGRDGMAGTRKEDIAARRRTEQTTAGIRSVGEDPDSYTGVQMGTRTEADTDAAGPATAAVRGDNGEGS